MSEPKAGWQRVRLGDVALNSTLATRDPVGDGYQRYIIGKHIPEDGSLIRTWNPVGDAEFGSRIRTIFRAGDIICTTRGPKLKVAVPEFDGLSAHTNFILRTRDPGVLLQGILEAVVRSDGFQDHLRKHFRGSTNLFVNWADAAQYEFALPPLEEQLRAIQLLRAASSLVISLDAAHRAHRTLTDVYSRALLSETSDEDARSTTLGKACKRVGVGIASSASHAYRPSGVPFIRNTNIKAGRIDTSEILFVDPAYAELHRGKRVFKGDVVMTRTATDVPGDAAVVPAALDGAQAFTILVCTPDEALLDSEYLCHWINGQPGRAFIRSRRGGAKQQNLGATFLADMPIRLPPLARQRQIVAQLHDLDATGQLLMARLELTRRLVAAMRKDAFAQ